MRKVNGNINDYSIFKEQDMFFVIGYGLTQVSKDMYSWYELYFFKNKYPKISIDIIKSAVIKDIDSQTDEIILNGFTWRDMPVYLSKENQFNYKAAYDLALQTQGASLPVKFKLGQTPYYYENIGTDENPEYERRGGDPVYYTFETLEDISDFYVKAIAFINQTLNEGWTKKDSIDWSNYVPKEPEPEPTPEPGVEQEPEVTE